LLDIAPILPSHDGRAKDDHRTVRAPRYASAMPKITKVYTRTGDDGTTALGSRRVAKDDLRVACYGTVDETNSAIGAALAAGLDARVDAMLRRVQNELFHMGSDLWMPEADKKKSPVPTIAAGHVKALEKDIDAMQRTLAPLANFVLPGGSPGAAALHVARTTCRRAERLVVELARKEAVGAHVVPYLNRLSDFLFVASRVENRAKGVDEPVWDSRA
jgi:cob(I)alamin adenosyltransferase